MQQKTTSIVVNEVTPLLEKLFKNNPRTVIYTDVWENNGATFAIKETHRHIPCIVIDNIEYVLVITAPEKIAQVSPTIPVLCTQTQITAWLNAGILPLKKSKEMKRKRLFFLLFFVLLFAGCGSDNIKTHSSHPKSRQAKDTTAHSRSLNNPEKEQSELESEVKYSAIKTELTVSIPQTIFKNLRLEISAETPETLEQVTLFINNNLENLRYIASDEDLKSELDRLLREKFNGEAVIIVKGNRVVQPIDSTKVTKPTPKPVIEDTRKFHIVNQGEGYLSIARKYGVNVNSLYKLNPGKKTLTKGDKIRIK